MKKLLCLVLASMMFFGYAEASSTYSPSTPVHVKPYTKKDGTHVDGHYRAKPGQGCGGNGCHR